MIATSCSDMYKGCEDMPDQTVGTGEIINDALILYTNLDPATSHLILNSKEGQIITSDTENIFGLEVSFDNKETCQPIDFSKYTVLGKNANGDCKVVFDRNVTKHEEQQKYIYKIKLIHCGSCEKLVVDMNWVLVPKIEDDYSVEFIVDYKRWKGK